jgi:hypothetical protein
LLFAPTPVFYHVSCGGDSLFILLEKNVSDAGKSPVEKGRDWTKPCRLVTLAAITLQK